MDAPIPRQNDVLFGRGAAINKHHGNMVLRTMVDRRRQAFVEASRRKEKRRIAADIVRAIHELRPPGRFLTEDRSRGGGEGGGVEEDGTAAGAADENDDVGRTTMGRNLSAATGVHRAILKKAWVRVEPDKAHAKVMHRLRERERADGVDEGGGRRNEATRRGPARHPPPGVGAFETRETTGASSKPAEEGTVSELGVDAARREARNADAGSGHIMPREMDAISDIGMFAASHEQLHDRHGDGRMLGEGDTVSELDMNAAGHELRNEVAGDGRIMPRMMDTISELGTNTAGREMRTEKELRRGSAREIVRAPPGPVSTSPPTAAKPSAAGPVVTGSPPMDPSHSTARARETAPDRCEYRTANKHEECTLRLEKMQNHNESLAQNDGGIWGNPPSTIGDAMQHQPTAAEPAVAGPVIESNAGGPIAGGLSRQTIGPSHSCAGVLPAGPSHTRADQHCIGDASRCRSRTGALNAGGPVAGGLKQMTNGAGGLPAGPLHTRADQHCIGDASRALGTSPERCRSRTGTDAEPNGARAHAEGPGDLDGELDSFLRDFSRHYSDCGVILLLTLREWIERTRRRAVLEGENDATRRGGTSSGAASGYVASALPVSLQLAESLAEAEAGERDGRGNGIPLAGIAAGSVMVRARALSHPTTGGVEGGARGTDDDGDLEIDRVWITSRVGDDPDVGGKMPRLFALGVVLYELFDGGGEVPAFHGHGLDDFEATSVDSIRLDDGLLGGDDRLNDGLLGGGDGGGPRTKTQKRLADDDAYFEGVVDGRRPRKKSHKLPAHRNVYSECVAGLESKGIPQSLRALVKNLLDCHEGDFRGEGCYSSFHDVRSDLRLMSDDPSRFLDDIPTNPPPSLRIRDKLYGRRAEAETIELSHQEHASRGSCSGVIITGGAGVGKSKLATHARRLACRSGRYFLGAKFDQNYHVNPLAEIGSVFNSLCDSFARDASPSQLRAVAEALDGALGDGIEDIACVLPSLSNLVPASSSSGRKNASSVGCVDSALSMRFLFSELLCVISSHCGVSFLFDDVQWADTASMLLIESLISSTKGSRSVFFTLCHRDDEIFRHDRLQSIKGFSLTKITLKNMDARGINELVSDALHLSPRLTRPLSSVLQHKTSGNILFLRTLMESLEEQGHIYFDSNRMRWAWDLNEILDPEISDDIVALLIKEMRMLPDDLQLCLKIVSCIGSFVNDSVLDILSSNVDANLPRLLRQVSQKGFMNRIDSAVSRFSFVHDKIQQAARELMPEQERLHLHMRLGMAIFSHVFDTVGYDNDLFFVAISQINQGGPGVVSDPGKRKMISELNLKAGERAIALSDFNAALKLFEHGISYLLDDAWTTQYHLAIDLFDKAAEAACIINNGRAVTFYTNELIKHARCSDDKLNCLFSSTRVLLHANLLHEAKESMLDLIQKCGERLPQPMVNKELDDKMGVMNDTLRIMSDESILNMEETKNGKIVFLQKVYAELANLLLYLEPSRVGAVSLRMVDLTLRLGLTRASPLAFIFYGAMLVSMGNEHVSEGCRLGRIALRLLEKSYCSTYKASAICVVYFTVLWASDPLQSIAEAHMLGHRAGMQSGDFLYSMLNEQLANITNYTAGIDLSILREKFREHILKMESKYIRFFAGRNHIVLWHLQVVVLQDGERRLNEECVDGILGLRQDLNAAGELSLLKKIFHVQRAFFFHRFEDISFDVNNITDVISEEVHQLRPVYLMGIFFEGLVSFQCARLTNDEARAKWVEKGESALAKMLYWTEHCRWNFESKMLLLKAERMRVSGEFARAEDLYTRSIRSARDHEFVHEEAIASEIAGAFLYERSFPQKSLAFFQHSVKCYKEWGALAVAGRVESSLRRRFGLGIHPSCSIDDYLMPYFATRRYS